MRILVIGATSYVGEPVATALRRCGHAVVGMTRDPGSPRARALAAAEIRIVAGDLGEPAGCRAAVTGAEVVVQVTADGDLPPGHAAALVREVAEANDRDGRRRHVVLTALPGGGGVGIDPDELAAGPVPHTTIRPGLLYGRDARTSPIGRWFAEAAAGRATFSGDAAQAWPWVHVDDLAAAYVTVVARAGLPALGVDKRVDGESFCVAEEDPPSALEVFSACVRTAGYRGAISFATPGSASVPPAAGAVWGAMDRAETRRCLGWSPRHAGVLDDLDTYYDAWRAGRAGERDAARLRAGSMRAVIHAVA
jgi:nucleoside-diphosphate-sugar epimerase